MEKINQKINQIKPLIPRANIYNIKSNSKNIWFNVSFS